MGSSRTRPSALAARSSPQAATAYLSSPLPLPVSEIGLTRPLDSEKRARARRLTHDWLLGEGAEPGSAARALTFPSSLTLRSRQRGHGDAGA